jgi:hypothetical protein
MRSTLWTLQRPNWIPSDDESSFSPVSWQDLHGICGRRAQKCPTVTNKDGNKIQSTIEVLKLKLKLFTTLPVRNGCRLWAPPFAMPYMT